MSNAFNKLLKKFIWPRYQEKGPPSYFDSIFFDKECIDSTGQINQPVKSILDLTVLGYRPVTTLSIFSVLIENQNRPMYGAHIGRELEDMFQLPKGWYTKTRYYDNRVGKLLKILCRLGYLEETEIVDSLTKRRLIGYHISESIYAATKERMNTFAQGGGFSIFSPPVKTVKSKTLERTGAVKRCTNCQALTTSTRAQHCELCGSPLKLVCPKCNQETSLEYLYCLSCGQRIARSQASRSLTKGKP